MVLEGKQHRSSLLFEGDVQSLRPALLRDFVKRQIHPSGIEDRVALTAANRVVLYGESRPAKTDARLLRAIVLLLVFA
jgi:hypothetical protein